MKILYASYIRFPSERAHAIQVANMANAFVALGHTVSLLTTSRKKNVNRTFEEYFGCKQQFDQVTVWIPEWAVAYGLATKCWQIIFAIRVTLIVRKQQPDLVFSRDEWVLYVISLLSPRTKITWESHEGKWNQAAKRLVAKQVPIIAISEGIRDSYVNHGVPEEQLMVAHDAIDDSFLGEPIEKHEARERLHIPADRKVVMYIGGLDEWKGAKILCEAAEDLPESIFVYFIGGKEKEIAQLRAKYPRSIFLGSRPYKDLVWVQQAPDVLVIPNTAKNELSRSFTSPLKLFAHMTSGVPLVVSDIPSLRAVLTDKTATFVAPDDSVALEAGISGVFKNYEEACTRAVNAKEQVTKFTWKNRAQEILSFVIQ